MGLGFEKASKREASSCSLGQVPSCAKPQCAPHLKHADVAVQTKDVPPRGLIQDALHRRSCEGAHERRGAGGPGPKRGSVACPGVMLGQRLAAFGERVQIRKANLRCGDQLEVRRGIDKHRSASPTVPRRPVARFLQTPLRMILAPRNLLHSLFLCKLIFRFSLTLNHFFSLVRVPCERVKKNGDPPSCQ